MTIERTHDPERIAAAQLLDNLAASPDKIQTVQDFLRFQRHEWQAAHPFDLAKVVNLPPKGIPFEEIERLAIVGALEMTRWVQKDAAELLSISPRVMNYKIKILKIEYRGNRW